MTAAPSPRGDDASFESVLSQLQIATPYGGSGRIDAAVNDLLRLIREHLAMDVVLVSEFIDGQQVFRHVETAPEDRVVEQGQGVPLGETFCQLVVGGLVPPLINDVPAFREEQQPCLLPDTPFPIGAYMAVPVLLRDGRIYGTLCCFSFEPNKTLGERELKRLEMSAQLTARLLDETDGIGASAPDAVD